MFLSVYLEIFLFPSFPYLLPFVFPTLAPSLSLCALTSTTGARISVSLIPNPFDYEEHKESLISPLTDCLSRETQSKEGREEEEDGERHGFEPHPYAWPSTGRSVSHLL